MVAAVGEARKRWEASRNLPQDEDVLYLDRFLGYLGKGASQSFSTGNYKQISNSNDAHAQAFSEKCIDVCILLWNAQNKMDGWIYGFRVDRYVTEQVQ